jgi:hypothetical protein
MGPPLAAALAILVLIQPQVMRLLGLLQAPPAVVSGQAVPGGWLPFLDAMSRFWFMSAGWGPLETHAPALRKALLACVYLLFVLGLARGGGRMRRLVVTTVLLPIAIIGLAAGRLDFRDRHLAYLLPLIWLALANGALGEEGEEGLTLPPPALRASRALLAIVAAASAWLLVQKLPERSAEWTQLMEDIRKLQRPEMVLYMAPSPLTGTPTLIASRLDPTGAMRIRPLSEETRLDFLAEASQGRDFAFLTSDWYRTAPEQAWRVRHLEGLGYEHVPLRVAGADAQVFSRREGPRLAAEAGESRRWADRVPRLQVHRTGPGSGRLQGRLETAPRSATDMHERSGPDGDGGLGVRWELGALPWDAVGRTRQRSGNDPRVGLWAHPRDGTTLVIESEETALGDALEGFYGLTDYSIEQSRAAKVSDPIRFRVSLDGETLLEREVPRARGWAPFSVALPRGGAGARRLRVEIGAPRDTWAHFVFDLAPR